MKRFSGALLHSLTPVIAISLAVCIIGSAIADPLEGVDYVLIPAQPIAVRDKIEVIEFFYYGCESCNRLEPHLQSWLKTLSPDISFRRIPALRRTAWMPLTRVYFALEQLGEIETMHTEVYRAVHEEGINLGVSSEFFQWVQKRGLDRNKVEEVLDSDSVIAKVQYARDATVAYAIRATPSFVVDGRYLTSPGMLRSSNGLFPTLDILIEKVRLARNVK
jgi:thiol:disulfide interchange protein DsbA